MQEFFRCRQIHLDSHTSEQLTKIGGEFDAGVGADADRGACGLDYLLRTRASRHDLLRHAAALRTPPPPPYPHNLV